MKGDICAKMSQREKERLLEKQDTHVGTGWKVLIYSLSQCHPFFLPDFDLQVNQAEEY